MIRVLPESLVNKIAAGEVIVRPASVIKELVENSLDAGAKHIWVEVGNGCRDLRVRDDGCGMPREDAELSVVRHATSKIGSFDDLWTLVTRGFRGEALASIAAVSRLQILTRTADQVAGTRIEVEGGGPPAVEPAGAPPGTEIRVRELFFNTPARLKFMKSPAAELQQVLTIVTRQALIRPDVGFNVMNERSAMLDVQPDQPWDERIAMLLGSQIHGNLLPVNMQRHNVAIRGFALKPEVTRKDRRQQFFFVNGRPITSRALSSVLQQAYHGLVMTQRFPVAVLDIEVPAGEVDINVHPTKEEVRFRNESGVNGTLHRAVHECLVAANLVPTAHLGDGPADGPAPPPAVSIASPANFQDDMIGAPVPEAPFHQSGRMPGDFSQFTAHVQAPPLPPVRPRSVEEAAQASAEVERLQYGHAPAPAGQPAQPQPLPQEALDEARVFRDGYYPEPLGQVSQCYIVARSGEDLLLIDQHAAHERLLYQQLCGLRQSQPTQQLLLPISVDVPAAALPYMHEILPILCQLGLQTQHFGGLTFLVQSVPADMPNMDVEGVIVDLLDDFEASGRPQQVDALRDRVVTRMACRAAIKAGQDLHMDEMRALIRQLAAARLGFTCPHGRPTMILLTRDQLDRQFKRRL